MTLAVYGATSTIAKDFVELCALNGDLDIHLFCRTPDAINEWQDSKFGKRVYKSFNLNKLGVLTYDAIINFIGVGDPAKAKGLSNSIIETTQHYDEIVIEYLKKNSSCKYIFLSSGAVYGGNFHEPAGINSQSVIEINRITNIDYYSASKLIAELKHRSLSNLSIVDVRIFNYVSCNFNRNSRFLISDIFNAVRDGNRLIVGADDFVRDYLHPIDFYSFIKCIINADHFNGPLDCYTREPSSKSQIIETICKSYTLNCEWKEDVEIINATGIKLNYFSKNYSAGMLGYKPSYNSTDGVLNQLREFIESNCG